MRIALLAAAMACGLATGAQAAVRYTLVNPVFNQAALDARASLNFNFTVSDAAVARGSFNLRSVSGSFPGGSTPVYTGDVADFVSFTDTETVTPATLAGRLAIDATFRPDGSISASAVSFFGISEEAQFSGSSAAFGGTFASDNFGFRCSSGDGCAATGQLAATTVPNPVPEPISMAMLGVGLLGMVAARRRQAD